MTQFKDTVLSELVRKKKSLLDDLLVLSIKSVYEMAMAASELRKRADLLRMLEMNDAAIVTREQQIGIDATIQEQALFTDISVLLSSIQDNNQAALLKLELSEKEFETERSKLGKGKKLSSYVIQTKAMRRYRQKNIKDEPGSNLIKGTL